MRLETVLTKGLAGMTLADLPSYRDARESWADWRAEHGRASTTALLTEPGSNPKLNKGAGVPIYGLSLAPAGLAGINCCPWSTRGCRAACLNTAGKGAMDTVQAGRILRTQWAAADPVMFTALVVRELERGRDKYGAIGARLNVLSDIRWEIVFPSVFELEGVTFYDYTKDWNRISRPLPTSYHLTLSASERTSVADIRAAVDAGAAVSVVFDGPAPTSWHGMPVIDGDKDDRRWADRGVIIGLKAKGRARDDRTGFVFPLEPTETAVTIGA